MDLAEKLSRLMWERQIDVAELSRRTGINSNTVRNYVKPSLHRVPTAPNGVAIANALEVDPAWLFDDRRGWPPPRCGPPPFSIYPWPPDGLTWEDVQTAVAAYAIEKCLKHFRSIEPVLFGTESGQSLPDEAWARVAGCGVLELVGAIGRLYIDRRKETEAARKVLDSHPVAGPWLARLTQEMSFKDSSRPHPRKPRKGS